MDTNNTNEISKKDRFIVGLKYSIIILMDFMLFSLCNMAICFLTQDGHVAGTAYAEIAFSYLHFFLAGGIAIIINLCFGLYKSVWRYAGIEEIISGIGSAVIQSAALFVIDRLLFKQMILGGQGGLPYCCYIMFFFFISIAIKW